MTGKWLAGARMALASSRPGLLPDCYAVLAAVPGNVAGATGGMRACITDEQRFLLLANGRESLDNPDFDPAPVVTPDAGETWLLTEISPDDHDHTFGLCDWGCPKLAGSACRSWRPCAGE